MSLVELRKEVERKTDLTDVCAHRKCKDKATEAHDVWSWFVPQERQVPMHYEVCAKHGAEYFGGSFDRSKGDRVKKDLADWASLNGPALNAHRELLRRSLQIVTSIAAHEHLPDDDKLREIRRTIQEAMPDA